MLNFFKIFYKVLLCKEPSFNSDYINKSYLVLNGILDTLLVSFLSCFIAYFIGLIIGICLYLCKILNNKKIYFIINFLVNIIISTPPLLLIILIIQFILGPYFQIYYGFKSALFCLSFILSFLFARHCEQIFLQINCELFSTAYTLGSNIKQFVTLFLLKESMPYLILRLNSLFVSALAYTNILGVLGIKGIGFISYEYGFRGIQDFQEQGFSNFDLIWVCVLIMFGFIQIFNLITNFIFNKLNKN